MVCLLCEESEESALESSQRNVIADTVVHCLEDGLELRDSHSVDEPLDLSMSLLLGLWTLEAVVDWLVAPTVKAKLDQSMDKSLVVIVDGELSTLPVDGILVVFQVMTFFKYLKRSRASSVVGIIGNVTIPNVPIESTSFFTIGVGINDLNSFGAEELHLFISTHLEVVVGLHQLNFFLQGSEEWSDEVDNFTFLGSNNLLDDGLEYLWLFEFHLLGNQTIKEVFDVEMFLGWNWRNVVEGDELVVDLLEATVERHESGELHLGAISNDFFAGGNIGWNNREFGIFGSGGLRSLEVKVGLGSLVELQWVEELGSVDDDLEVTVVLGVEDSEQLLTTIWEMVHSYFSGEHLDEEVGLDELQGLVVEP